MILLCTSGGLTESYAYLKSQGKKALHVTIVTEKTVGTPLGTIAEEKADENPF